MNHKTKYNTFPPVLQSYIEDSNAIPYRKELNTITGYAISSILLQQAIYWAKKQNPFYKFKSPCQHELYREGDSWLEELGFSRDEFEKAIAQIGTKIKKGDKKAEIAARQDPRSLILYWTGRDRVTWWELNVPLADRLLTECLEQCSRLSKVLVEHQIKKGLAEHQIKLMMQKRFRSRSEITSETTTECERTRKNAGQEEVLVEPQDLEEQPQDSKEPQNLEEQPTSVKNPKSRNEVENLEERIGDLEYSAAAVKNFVAPAAKNALSPAVLSSRTGVNLLPDESAIVNVYNAHKPKKWRSLAAGTIVGSSVLGLQFFMGHSEGDSARAIKLLEGCLRIACSDEYQSSKVLRANQVLDPNSPMFLGHFLGDVLASEAPTPVAMPQNERPANSVGTNPNPTFFFGAN